MGQRLTPYDLAKKLKIRPQRVYNWCERLGLPHTRTPDGKIWLDLDETKKWLERHKDA